MLGPQRDRQVMEPDYPRADELGGQLVHPGVDVGGLCGHQPEVARPHGRDNREDRPSPSPGPQRMLNGARLGHKVDAANSSYPSSSGRPVALPAENHELVPVSQWSFRDRVAKQR